jgi:hypothetical protein
MKTLKRRIDLFEGYDNDKSLSDMISHKLKEFNFPLVRAVFDDKY